MVKFIFTFDLKLGEVKVRKAKFWKSRFSLKPYLSCPVLSQDSKNVIWFVLRHLEIPKIKFQKVTSLPIPFLGHCSAKNKDILLESLYTCCWHIVLQYIFRFVLDILKKWFLGIYFWKSIVWFFVAKKQTFRKSEMVILWSV